MFCLSLCVVFCFDLSRQHVAGGYDDAARKRLFVGKTDELLGAEINPGFCFIMVYGKDCLCLIGYAQAQLHTFG